MSRVRNHQVRTRRGAVTVGGMCAGAGQSRTHLRAHQLYTQSRRTTHTRLPSPMRTGNKLTPHKRRWQRSRIAIYGRLRACAVT